MAEPHRQSLPALPAAVAVAVEDLRRSTAPPLTDPDAPVRLADVPAGWRAHLLDHPAIFGAVVSPRCVTIERADWERLLALVARQLDCAFRLAGLLALAERGPTPEDLAGAPVLSHWAPAMAWFGSLVLAGHVTDHPGLGEAWIHTSVLVGLDPQGRWARSHSRWYRLGEPMEDGHRRQVRQAGVRATLIETDDAEVSGHFAVLRGDVARVLEPLGARGCERWT